MKNKLVTAINLLMLVLLFVLNIVLIHKFGVNSDSILTLVFAIIFALLYVFGRIFPDITTKCIHAISLKLYKNSQNIDIPIFIEAKRIFMRRLIYILICCNICLLLSLLTYCIK